MHEITYEQALQALVNRLVTHERFEFAWSRLPDFYQDVLAKVDQEALKNEVDRLARPRMRFDVDRAHDAALLEEQQHEERLADERMLKQQSRARVILEQLAARSEFDDELVDRCVVREARDAVDPEMPDRVWKERQKQR